MAFRRQKATVPLTEYTVEAIDMLDYPVLFKSFRMHVPQGASDRTIANAAKRCCGRHKVPCQIARDGILLYVAFDKEPGHLSIRRIARTT